MLDNINDMIGEIKREKQYALDIETMDKYFLAYGLDKNSLTFNLLFPPSVDIRYAH